MPVVKKLESRREIPGGFSHSVRRRAMGGRLVLAVRQLSQSLAPVLHHLSGQLHLPAKLSFKRRKFHQEVCGISAMNDCGVIDSMIHSACPPTEGWESFTACFPALRSFRSCLLSAEIRKRSLVLLLK